MTDLFTAISQFGFPIALAVYLLWRYEKKLEKTSDRLQDLTDVIEGKPSEGKPGLINTIEKNTQATNNLVRIVTSLRRRK